MGQMKTPREAPLLLPDGQPLNWFAWQRSPGGGLVPVAFDEHPKNTPTMTRDLLWKTVRPIPPDMQAASLAVLAEWAGEAEEWR